MFLLEIFEILIPFKTYSFTDVELNMDGIKFHTHFHEIFTFKVSFDIEA